MNYKILKYFYIFYIFKGAFQLIIEKISIIIKIKFNKINIIKIEKNYPNNFLAINNLIKRKIKHTISKIKLLFDRFIIGIMKRADNALFEKLNDRFGISSIKNYIFEDQKNNSRLSFYIFASIFLSKKYENESTKRLIQKCFNNCPINILTIHEYRNFATQLFLAADYKNAQIIWTYIENFRKNKIIELKLENIGIRFLSEHWFIAIGHIAHLDSYIKNHILHNSHVVVLMKDNQTFEKVANPYLLSLYKKYLNNTKADNISINLTNEEKILLEDDFWCSGKISDTDYHMFNKFGYEIQNEWINQNRAPIIKIDPVTEKFGWKILEKNGFKKLEHKWFVCLHVREPGFHLAWHKKNPGTRNADINTYAKAIEFIKSKGGFIVRMGDNSMSPINIEGVYDYANSDDRNSMLDIFMCAKCKFFIGTNSGLSLVPGLFGINSLLTNWSPIAIPQWYPHDIFLPKLVADKNGNLLKFKELFSTGAGWEQFNSYFERRNLYIIDNSADEILQGVIDMFNYLDNHHNLELIENDLVNQFKNLSNAYTNYFGSNIAPSYIKKYQYLLD